MIVLTVYLTNLGENVLKKLDYQVKAKKYSLLADGQDICSYAYQAIQQREIAIDDLFFRLITNKKTKSTDKDLSIYYDYLAKTGQKLKLKIDDRSDYFGDYITNNGIEQVSLMYLTELKATQAAWHDGIFVNQPNIEDITQTPKCTVNTNFLERQQGYRVALKALRVPQTLISNLEQQVYQGIYTMTIDDNYSNYYKKLK